jgi:hypothetical protein
VHNAQIICTTTFFVAFIVSILIQEAIRSELVSRLYADKPVGWREFRTARDWFGQGGMWSLHREYYPESRLRFWFAASLSVMILAIALGSLLQAYGVR